MMDDSAIDDRGLILRLSLAALVLIATGLGMLMLA